MFKDFNKKKIATENLKRIICKDELLNVIFTEKSGENNIISFE
jgi:hypothetical protein